MTLNARSKTDPDDSLARMNNLPMPARWALAMRLKTLGLSVTPVLAGTALAAQAGRWNTAVAVAAMLSAVLIQIGTNLWNDAADAESGIDTRDRQGPPRMTAMGMLLARHVRYGALIAFVLSGIGGTYLVSIGGLPVVVIGLLSLALGYLYSAGPYPLSATPIGELLVLLFFGFVAVSATAWLHGLPLSFRVIQFGGLTGLPAAAVLLLNNHRDRQSDARGGRITLAILIGERASRIAFIVLILAALGGFAALVPVRTANLLFYVPAAILAVHLAVSVWITPVSKALNALIAKTALFQLLLVLALFVD